MRNFLLGLIIFGMASAVTAKYGEPTYLFSGRVTDSRGVPVQGVAVGISWAVKGVPHGPELGATDRNGAYAIVVEFPVNSSWSLFGAGAG